MTARRSLSFAVLLTVAAVAAPARTAPSGSAPVVRGETAERADRFIAQLADSGFNGSVLIATGDDVVLHKGYGWADLGRTEPVTIDTPFWVASISKQFAAAALLALTERDLLSLDDSIARFLPGVPPDKQGITLHQLLTHTAGLEQRYAADGIRDRDEAVRALLAPPLGTLPGEAFSYSNDAYNLVAAVVEVVAAKSFEPFLRERLLVPAGLAHTGFWGPAGHPDVAAIRAPSSDSTFLEPNWGFRGGTGMFSTPGDLYRWHQAIQGDRVLSASSRKRLLTPHVDRGTAGVGYGWFVSPTPRGTTCLWTRGYESFGHGAVLASYPEERIVIVVASSSGERAGGGPVSHALAQELAELVFAHP